MKKTREISIQTEELNEKTICYEQKFILLMSKILKELEQQKQFFIDNDYFSVYTIGKGIIVSQMHTHKECEL